MLTLLREWFKWLLMWLRSFYQPEQHEESIMSSPLLVEVPFPVFQDRDGQPLDNGYVWLGVADLNPQTNPVAVYFDSALTIPATQPLRTINGYISSAGSPAQVYIDGVNYSILVQDNKGTMIYSFADGTGISPNSSGVIYTPAGTNAVVTNVQAKLRETVSVKDFGAVGDGVADDTAAIQAAIDYAYDSGVGKVYFPSGNYKITKSLLVWGAEPNPYFNKSVTLEGQDKTNTIITKTTNNGFGGASPYASDDAIFVFARRDLTAGNNVTLGSIAIRNFNLNGDFGTGKVAYGIFNRCGTGSCTLDSLVVQAAIGFETITDFYLSRVTNTTFVVSTKGFSMLAAGTSNYLCNVFVAGATVEAYTFRGGYSSADSLACDVCTGVCYRFNFGSWVINGLGSESPDATVVVASNNATVIINNPFIFPQNDAAAKVFDITSAIVTINGGYIGAGDSIPVARTGQLANVGITGVFELNNTEVIDTYAVANSNRFTRSAGATKSGAVSVPTATPTALRTLENNQVGIFIAYDTNNANVFATAYAGAANGAGIFTLGNNLLTLTLVGDVVTVTQSTGSTLDVAYQYIIFGEALLP